MHILMVGVNFKTAPVHLREMMAVPDAALPAALGRLGALPAAEAALLSTCNRTEVYALVEEPQAGIEYLTRYLADLGGLSDTSLLKGHIYSHQDLDAASHLFRVAAGLDSMVVGETQILGQVRDAYRDAVAANLVGKVLHQLLEQAIAAGKRAQTETRIGQNAVSVSYAAVELAKKVFRSLNGHRCLAIGAGETAKLTVRHLQASGVKEIVIANRTMERAERLAAEIGGVAVPFASIPEQLQLVDVVISSTGSPGYVLTRAMLTEAARHRRGRPIFLFDIAVPRDIDPEIGLVAGAFLYNIDDLQSVVSANLHERAEEARAAGRIIDEELNRFRGWLATLEVVPTIRLLREKVESIRKEELTRTLGRLPDLTDRERALIEAMTFTMVNKILNDPTQQLKGMADEGAADQAIDTIARLFDLPAGELKPVKKGGEAG